MSDALIMGRDEALDICEGTLAASSADATEVLLVARRSGLTRFAGNHIHQSVSETNASVTVRAAMGSSVGVASTNDTSADGLADVAERAGRLASLATPDEQFPGLPKPGDVPQPLRGVQATTEFGPAERAKAVGTCIEVARERRQTAAGACSAAVTARAVANSRGLRAWQETTHANLRMVFSGADSSGYAEAHSEDASEIAPRALAEVAADKCARSASPTAVEPGRYDVILEPPAVADLLSALGSTAFNALAWHEGRSPLCGRLGEQVCGENVTIFDDGLDPRTLRQSFDFEGVPKRRVELVTEGVATGLVHDTRTAALMGASSTGHALPPDSPWGAVPTNIFLQPGGAGVYEMIAATDRGLLVTRFHYTNLVNPRQAILTGMTRDGTFLIQDGEVAGPVRNLRFTESILEALSRVSMIGRDGRLCGRTWAPALKIHDFRFSGATEF
ncbi:MAG: TldD/PmbA family protein [Armatimonadota bacterium]|nr:TldD/PmbA family protein [Armatimonadota bacterium]